MKRLLFSILALAALSTSLGGQSKYTAEVDSLVALAPAYNEYNQMRRGLFEVLPISSDDIVFLGDSITDRCEWDELFGNPNIKNRGISGDRVRWMFDRYEQIAKGHPAKLFILAGINDLRSGKTKGHDLVVMYAELIYRFRKISPETKIYIQSILPVNLTTKQNAKFANSNLPVRIDNCNTWLKKWAPKNNVTYIDIASAFKNEEGQMNLDYTFDGLHPNSLGYLIWKDIIAGYVNE